MGKFNTQQPAERCAISDNNITLYLIWNGQPRNKMKNFVF